MASLWKRLVERLSGARPVAGSGSKGRWCLTGNIVQQRYHGEGHADIRRGTKHFPPGAKVYCLPVRWGDGYEKIVVVGRHRGSHRYCRMIVSYRHITNWRAKVVYSPEVLRLMDEGTEKGGAGSWKGREEIDAMLGFLLDREREEEGKRPGSGPAGAPHS